MIGVLGGSGAVGRTTVARLAGFGLGPLRIGGRDLARARQVCDTVTGEAATPAQLDLSDPAQLAAFCAGCRVVVNCAGPSYQVLDTVARAALATGAHYVDAAGDRPALDALSVGNGTPALQRAAVFSAGTMPGLTGLLPRLLVAGEPPGRVDAYVGGATAITPLSAVDMLLTRGPCFGTPLAAWRGGRIEERALRPLRSVSLPGFPARAHAWPFLSTEAASLAAELKIGEFRNYIVYVTESLPTVLATAWADDPEDLDIHAGAVVAAAERDLAAGVPFYVLLFQSRPGFGAGGRARRLLLTTSDPYALSGVVCAVAVRDVLDGRIGAGAHLAAEVLNAEDMLTVLGDEPLVTELDLQ